MHICFHFMHVRMCAYTHVCIKYVCMYVCMYVRKIFYKKKCVYVLIFHCIHEMLAQSI